MPTVTLNKTVFEELVGKTLPLDELKDRISMLGTDLEGIEGDEIEVEIFPNRPDLLSEQGFARAFSSFIGVKTGLRKYDVKKSGETVIVDASVKEVRPYTVCAIVRDMQFDDEKIREIIQVQEKLHTTFCRNRKKSAICIYPLDKITLPIHFKALPPNEITFQPLESDKEMSGMEILQDHPKGKDFASLLEGKSKWAIFTDVNNEILSLTPIINSHKTGKVNESTKDVFIEFSGFDLTHLKVGLNILTTVFADMGGKIESMDVVYENETITTPNLEPTKKKLDLAYVNKMLGLELSEQEAVELLAKMGFGYENGNVLIPAYRNDILHQADFVEDIAIAYGYENFEEEIPNVATIGKEAPLEIFSRKIREILIGLQLLETKNYHLITKEELNERMNDETDVIPLQNALGEHNHLRNAILPSLLKTLSLNQHHEYPQNLFEIGRTFRPGDSETGVLETEKLAMVTCHATTDFTQMRQLFGSLMQSLGLHVTVKECDHPSYIRGRVGNVYVNDTKIGIIGEMSPSVLENWGLVVPVVAMELNLEMLFELCS